MSRMITMQGFIILAITVTEKHTLVFYIATYNSDKVNGARNIGQGYRSLTATEKHTLVFYVAR